MKIIDKILNFFGLVRLPKKPFDLEAIVMVKDVWAMRVQIMLMEDAKKLGYKDVCLPKFGQVCSIDEYTKHLEKTIDEQYEKQRQDYINKSKISK